MPGGYEVLEWVKMDGCGKTRSDHVFFFFQAEDGIRDVAVTGVQTCALPIWAADAGRAAAGRLPARPGTLALPRARVRAGSHAADRAGRSRHRHGRVQHDLRSTQIGRASCRERV